MNGQMQQVIVYSNPIEAALWNGDYAGVIFPVSCGVVLFFVLFLISNWLLSKVLLVVCNRFNLSFWNVQNYPAYTAIFISLLISSVVAYKMMIF
jgi:hypothetical protein